MAIAVMAAPSAVKPKMSIDVVYVGSVSFALPTNMGMMARPKFWIKKIIEYAVPRHFNGIIFGTQGQRAAGAKE